MGSRRPTCFMLSASSLSLSMFMSRRGFSRFGRILLSSTSLSSAMVAGLLFFFYCGGVGSY